MIAIDPPKNGGGYLISPACRRLLNRLAEFESDGLSPKASSESFAWKFALKASFESYRLKALLENFLLKASRVLHPEGFDDNQEAA